MRSIPELLAPAGNQRCLHTAIRFGADAVYMGGERFSLRAKAKNFKEEELSSAIAYAHANGVRVYITLNIFAFDDDLAEIETAAHYANDAGADAVIVADIGAATRIHQAVPELPIHASTQANVTNAATAEVWCRAGATRIILARELSIERIAAMSRLLPDDLELEAFVHGSMCMAWSGRCFLSAEMNGRSANRGLCTQPCRWNWTAMETGKPQNRLFIEEGEGGSEIFSSQDLCMLNHLAELRDAGVTCFKIEGRTKSEYYVGTVTGAYRRRMDSVFAGAPWTDETAELSAISHRPYSTGFYYGTPKHTAERQMEPGEREYMAFVLDMKDGRALVEMKNRFSVGDRLETLTLEGSQAFIVQNLALAETEEPVPSVLVPGQKVYLNCPADISAGDMLRGPLRNRKK